MVAQDEMLDTAVAHELHAGRIDEEIALLVSGARYECRVEARQAKEISLSFMK
jgi:hypothetical protein